MEILKIFSNEILISLVSLLAGLIVYMVKNLIDHIKKETKEVLNKTELIHIDVKAMDYAIERTDGNGYQKFRDEEKKRLLTDSKFINK